MEICVEIGFMCDGVKRRGDSQRAVLFTNGTISAERLANVNCKLTGKHSASALHAVTESITSNHAQTSAVKKKRPNRK